MIRKVQLGSVAFQARDNRPILNAQVAVLDPAEGDSLAAKGFRLGDEVSPPSNFIRRFRASKAALERHIAELRTKGACPQTISHLRSVFLGRALDTAAKLT